MKRAGLSACMFHYTPSAFAQLCQCWTVRRRRVSVPVHVMHRLYVVFLALCAACSSSMRTCSPSVGLSSGELNPERAAAERESQVRNPQPGLFARWSRGESYLLDPVARYLDPTAPLACDAASMVVHRSTPLRYAVRVHPAFEPRLSRFDAFVRELATEHYGRPPRKLLHRGAFVCRTTRARKHRLSEHALGNALDFVGLEFGPLPRRAEAPEAMPKAMRRAFSVRVQAHWAPKRERDAYHARFLHRLAEELSMRSDIFRGIVGPPRPRHHDHLHFDAAPWRYALYAFEPVQEPERPN